jgi:chromosome segregation ATPase
MTELQKMVNDLSDQLNKERQAKEWAQQEYARVLSELEQKDYDLQNYKKYYESIQRSMEGFERENKALRELVRLWM